MHSWKPFRKLEDEVSLILYGNDEKPRYQIAVLDDPEVTLLSSFAVFIVPVGRFVFDGTCCCTLLFEQSVYVCVIRCSQN